MYTPDDVYDSSREHLPYIKRCTQSGRLPCMADITVVGIEGDEG